MIFVTVGTQLPFDRLVNSMDRWAGVHTDIDITVQSGENSFQPEYCKMKGFISSDEWQSLFLAADIVVSHAGMGTIIKCLDIGKPLIIMPRKASMNEHRNDHQIATSKQFDEYESIRVVNTEQELFEALDKPPKYKQSMSSDENENLNILIDELRNFALDIKRK